MSLFWLTIPELQDKCRQIGLPDSGTKAELVQRLQPARAKALFLLQIYDEFHLFIPEMGDETNVQIYGHGDWETLKHKKGQVWTLPTSLFTDHNFTWNHPGWEKWTPEDWWQYATGVGCLPTTLGEEVTEPLPEYELIPDYMQEMLIFLTTAISKESTESKLRQRFGDATFDEAHSQGFITRTPHPSPSKRVVSITLKGRDKID